MFPELYDTLLRCVTLYTLSPHGCLSSCFLHLFSLFSSLQIPSKTKSSLLSKPEKPKSVNVAKARRNALEQIMGELIEPVDNCPTQGLLLVPIKKKEKKHDIRVRKVTSHDHHQHAGLLSPGSGIATFPASPLPQTSTQSRSQNFRRCIPHLSHMSTHMSTGAHCHVTDRSPICVLKCVTDKSPICPSTCPLVRLCQVPDRSPICPLMCH